MSITLFPLVQTEKQVMRDQWAGASASIILPGSGQSRWFANGKIYTFPNSELPQHVGPLTGQTKPNTFHKDCCDCRNSL